MKGRADREYASIYDRMRACIYVMIPVSALQYALRLLETRGEWWNTRRRIRLISDSRPGRGMRSKKMTSAPWRRDSAIKRPFSRLSLLFPCLFPFFAPHRILSISAQNAAEEEVRRGKTGGKQSADGQGSRSYLRSRQYLILRLFSSFRPTQPTPCLAGQMMDPVLTI